ncbi:MAG: hypothetical protein GXP06_09985 [Alphaproteobacteria bacterium]|nr:hypothetical protein [Alphaproteobacteria bacterium]
MVTPMLWLALHMWFLLVLAFATGLGVGWWIWGARSAPVATLDDETTMGTLESDGAASDPPHKNQ